MYCIVTAQWEYDTNQVDFTWRIPQLLRLVSMITVPVNPVPLLVDETTRLRTFMCVPTLFVHAAGRWCGHLMRRWPWCWR